MSNSLRHRFFGAAFSIIDRTRLGTLLAPIARGRGAILMFHHVRPWVPREFAPNRLLEVTPEFLDEALTLVRQEGFDIIPLSDLPERLSDPRPNPFVVITFDDGYRDNITYAEPVLRRHRAPWTVFATTDYLSGEGRLWWVELEEAIASLPRVRVRSGGTSHDLPASTAAEKGRAFETVYWGLRQEPEPQLLQAIADLCDEAGIDRSALVARLCMDWNELTALSAAPGVSVGAHTLTHCMLAKQDAARVRQELSESRAILEERLGRPIRTMAYPVGDAAAAGPRDFALAREAGYDIAVTTRPGHVFAAHEGSLQALPRVSVNGYHQNAVALRAMLSGLPFLAWNAGRAVAS